MLCCAPSPGSASEFVELFVGRGAARVRDLFKQARASGPSIVFIDEIDAVGGKRGAGFNEERDQTLNQLLTELDGFNDRGSSGDGRAAAAAEDLAGPNVLLICATNRPEVLDDALMRPGRLSRKVEISLPNEKGRRDIARVYLGAMPLEPIGVAVGGSGAGSDQNQREEEYAALIAAGTGGCSGADIANVVNESVLMATRRGAARVAVEDVLQGIQRTKAPITNKEGLGTLAGASPIAAALQSLEAKLTDFLPPKQRVVRSRNPMP